MHYFKISAFLLLLNTITGQAAAFASTRFSNTPGLVVQDGSSVRKVLAHGFRRKSASSGLLYVLAALEKMQDTYFDLFAGTWPSAIDWTAAVMQTQISATLSTLVLGLENVESRWKNETTNCAVPLAWENIISRYFTQTNMFYLGEHALDLRTQAYDDMLWVVLEWLENLKFAEMYNIKRWKQPGTGWYGMQMRSPAAHRARVFYELASVGWDTSLCGGGMIWNPTMTPYKNAITNELFAAASISMYLYYPGDNSTNPVAAGLEPRSKPHDPVYLANAVQAYKWLKDSGMRSPRGLYVDGFHILGWRRHSNGTIDPGTGKCNLVNTMIYTYNQGVVLSASRGLWLATGAQSYLDDGHALVGSVMKATGWPSANNTWRGLGRAGVLEDFCDHGGRCSQDGQTFKGIFFHHLSEFCRPLWPQDEAFLERAAAEGTRNLGEDAYKRHLIRCATYAQWIEHNANAAWKTRNDDGLFGMWWGVSPDTKMTADHPPPQRLPPGAKDYLNPTTPGEPTIHSSDPNDRGRGRTVETQSGALAVLRAHWQWLTVYG